MAKGIGAAMAGGKRGNAEARPRQSDDWYPTPKEVTQSLIPYLSNVNGKISEPCCGDGALAKVLEENGFEVIGSDLVNRGYGDFHGVSANILNMKTLAAPNVITNPPFNIAADIIEGVMSKNPDFFALLLKSTYWHASKRMQLFEKYPPSKIIALTWRVDFLNLKRPTMEVIWCIWDKNHKGPTEYELVPRPVDPEKKKTRKPRKSNKAEDVIINKESLPNE